MEKTLLTRDETLDTASKLRKSMKLRNEIEFSETRMKTPDIDFYEDEEQFFDPSVWEIHIGSIGITNRFEAEDEKDFAKALEFVQGHESQHVHSTASKPYAWGIQRGTEVIMEYIASIEDPKRKFRREKDYERYAEELNNKGIYISWQSVRQMVAGISNSIEDGRIEGIRASKFKGFANLRTFYRGMFWRQGGDDELKDYSDINAGEKLRVIANQILFLSTCQLYQPNFFMTYVGTPMMDEVNELIPIIAKGVSAKTCREMATQVIEICKKLAPIMYEAFRVSEKDMRARRALEKMLSDILSAMIENGLDNISGISENNEEQGSGDFPSVFGESDLVITLPDDQYDKLMENADESESKGSGIQVRREHPKEEEKSDKPDNDSDGQGSGNPASDAEEKQDKAESLSAGQGDNSEEKDGKNSSSSESGDSSSENGEDSEDSRDSLDSESSSSSSEITDSDSNGKSAAQIDTSKNSEINDAVEKAMKEAAEKTDSAAEKMIDDINTSITHETRAAGKREVIDKENPVNPEDMQDICDDFIENKREYEVKDKMPAVLEARCRAMYRKNKRYFKSLSTPNVSHLDSGNVDPSLIYGLSFGDTEVFRKNGKDKKFDGCAYLLIDNSGSMMGNKRTEACKAAAVIEEGFKGLIPIKIVAFDEWGTIVHEVIKNWDESLSHNCCWNFCVHGRDGNGNEDGYDIKIATRELLKRPESRKMLCVLSDGAPGDQRLVNQAVKEARKKGVEVYSIFFSEGSISQSEINTMKYMYEKDYICCPLSELDENLSKLFKKFSRR